MPKKPIPAPNQYVIDADGSVSGATRQQKLYEQAIKLLQLMERKDEPYYLATSFGKDSIAAQRLCDEAGVKYEAYNNHTGIDPPELVFFGRKHYPDVTRNMPPASMWQLIVQKGIPPLRHMRYCCDILKEDGGKGRMCVMGIRAEESDRRKKAWAPVSEWDNRNKNSNMRLFDDDVDRMYDNDDIDDYIVSCIRKRGKITVNPLYHWTSADLWDFIHDRKMPYCSLYDEGFDRLGCVLCPMAGEEKRRYEMERWPKFAEAYIRAFQRLIDNGRMSDKGSAQAIMDWWISEKTQSLPPEEQYSLFDETDSLAQI